MRSDRAGATQESPRDLIGRVFPHVSVNTIEHIGAGVDYDAFEVNEELVFRLARKQEAREDLLKEARVLQFLEKENFPEVPVVRVLSEDPPVIGETKMRGVALMTLSLPDAVRLSLCAEVGAFLRRLHALPVERAFAAGIPTYGADPKENKEKYLKRYEAVANDFSKDLQERFERVLSVELSPPSSLVLGHNDISADHLFVDEGNHLVGVIDWGDAGITDPAFEFGRVYSAFGEDGFRSAMQVYGFSGNRELFDHRVRYYALVQRFSGLKRTKETGETENFNRKRAQVIKLLEDFEDSA